MGRGSRGPQVQRSVVSDHGGFDAPGFYYEKYLPATYKLKFYNDVGYLPDGTAMHLAGNALNHPETIGPDLHTPGSALPEGALMNTVGYLPDGTAMNLAGNALAPAALRLRERSWLHAGWHRHDEGGQLAQPPVRVRGTWSSADEPMINSPEQGSSVGESPRILQ